MHFTLLIAIMDNKYTSSKPHQSPSNDNSQTTNESSNSTAIPIVLITTSTADQTNALAIMLADPQFQYHLQILVNDQVL